MPTPEVPKTTPCRKFLLEKRDATLRSKAYPSICMSPNQWGVITLVDGAPLEDYVWLASRYPEAKLMLAHWGGLLSLYEMNQRFIERWPAYSTILQRRHYYSTNLSFERWSMQLVRRLLYSSDYLRLYPSKSNAQFRTFLEDIRSTGLS